MKKLKHSKYKNTGILFELLVRKLTSETLSSNKSVTIDIIKKYFGKNTELSKELHLYNSLIKEQFRSEALGLDYIRTIKATYGTLNQSILKRQRYNLIKEISEKFVFDNMAKTHVTNYKVLASAYMIFEYAETDNPKQLMECKSAILAKFSFSISFIAFSFCLVVIAQMRFSPILFSPNSIANNIAKVI